MRQKVTLEELKEFLRQAESDLKWARDPENGFTTFAKDREHRCASLREQIKQREAESK